MYSETRLTSAVEFRMIVFRPFKGEIIAAVVKRSTPSGIQRKLSAVLWILTDGR